MNCHKQDRHSFVTLRCAQGLARLFRFFPSFDPEDSLIYDAFGVCIYVHGVVTQEADEGDATAGGQFDGQAGGGGDRGDTGDAGQQGFLDDFE